MRPTTSPEKSALVALLWRGMKSRDIVGAILERDDPQVCLELLTQELRDSEGLFGDEQFNEVVEVARRQIVAWEAQGIEAHACFDSTYPAQLRDVREMPPMVFTRGVRTTDERAIAVVGTRRATDKGLRCARRIAEMLADRDITTVSGLALGVDTAAHRAALDAEGRTVAVVANGVDQCYPKANQLLQDEIVQRGLVLSAYLPETRPQKWQFLERNAVMSGYAAATIVVEAGERSGTRTQVARAFEHGRPVIFLENVLAVSWAKEAADKPGARIASNFHQLEEIIGEVIGHRALADELLPVSFPAVA